MTDGRRAAGVFLALAVLQILLFREFMAREVAWDYLLHGDPTWYTYFCYKVFHALNQREWALLWEQAVTSPWGVLLFLQSAIPQFLFGPSRASLVSVNLFYYLTAHALYVQPLGSGFTFEAEPALGTDLNDPGLFFSIHMGASWRPTEDTEVRLFLRHGRSLGRAEGGDSDDSSTAIELAGTLRW